MRAVLGIIVGLLVGFLALILIGIIGVGATYTVPADINLYDNRAVLELLLNMPPGPKIAFVVALFGWALVGAAIAKLIARRAWAAWTVTGLVTVYVVLSVIALPLAAWMQAVAIAAPLIGGLIANHLIAARLPAAATTDIPAADA